jgi:branched-subunit amino acid ABC-type transport system permease component
MARKAGTNWPQIGHYAFFLGVILAVIAGPAALIVGLKTIYSLAKEA